MRAKRNKMKRNGKEEKIRPQKRLKKVRKKRTKNQQKKKKTLKETMVSYYFRLKIMTKNWQKEKKPSVKKKAAQKGMTMKAQTTMQ